IDIQSIGQLKKVSRHLIYEYMDRIDPKISLAPIPESHLRAHAALLRDKTVTVVCAAKTLFEEVIALRGENVSFVPNGVDVAHFQVERDRNRLRGPLRKIVNLGRPIAGYFGALACWVDYELVNDLARLRPDLSVVMLGPDFDGSYAAWKRSEH